VKKNLAASIIVIFLLTLPILSFAKTAISDQELETLSAEAGVTLDFSAPTYTAGSVSGSVMVTNFAPTLFAWGDSDGFGSTYTGLGWVGATNITMGAASNIIMYNAMTLDVGSSGTATKLNVGLPSILIHPVETNVTLRVAPSDYVNDLYVLGSLYNDKFALIVNPSGVGSITISNHADNTQGLEMALSNFYLAIPSEEIDISWGDAGYGFDCAPEYRSATTTGGAANVTLAYGSAGYFGFRNYQHGDYGASNAPMLISMSGSANIDVGSSGTQTSMNIVLPTTTINPTRVHIYAPLVMSTAKELPGTQIVGILDVRGFSTRMTGSMQVYAH